MEIEVRSDSDGFGDIDYLFPLEEVVCNRETNYHKVAVPTEQGRLLLKFIKQHLFAKDIDQD